MPSEQKGCRSTLAIVMCKACVSPKEIWYLLRTYVRILLSSWKPNLAESGWVLSASPPLLHSYEKTSPPSTWRRLGSREGVHEEQLCTRIPLNLVKALGCIQAAFGKRVPNWSWVTHLHNSHHQRALDHFEQDDSEWFCHSFWALLCCLFPCLTGANCETIPRSGWRPKWRMNLSAGRIHHVMWSFSAKFWQNKSQKLLLYMMSGSLENKHFWHHVMW